MQFGYSTSRFPDHALADSVRLLQEIGYRIISIRLDAKALDPRPGNAMLAAQLETLTRELLPRTSIIVDTDARFLLDPRSPYGPSLSDSIDNDHPRLRLIEQTVEKIASRLNNATVVFGSGSQSPNSGAEDVLNQLGNTIDLLATRSREHSIPLALRPWTDHAVSSIAQYERLLQWIDEPINLAVDIGVMSKNSELPIVPKLSRHISHLRAVYLSADSGIDRSTIVDRLNDEGYHGPIIVGGLDNVDDPVATAAQEFARCESGTL